MAIVFTRQFTHDDWIDNEDVVQAGGGKGFNKRFHDLETEFDRISQVVQQVDTAISSLGQQVAAPITIGMLPQLLPSGVQPQWSQIFWSRVVAGIAQGTLVEKPGAQTEAWGVLALNLPNGAKLQALKVLGEQAGGVMVTDLVQELRTTPFTKTILVSVNGLGDATTAPTPIPGTPVFRGDQNLYYLLARVTGAAVGVDVKLRGFQITYLPF